MLEIALGSHSIGMSIMCFLVTAQEVNSRLETLFGLLLTVKVWAVLWLVCGLILVISSVFSKRNGIEWSSLVISALWAVVSIKSIENYHEFPTTACVAPIKAFCAGWTFIYHTKYSAISRANGRFAHGLSTASTAVTKDG